MADDADHESFLKIELIKNRWVHQPTFAPFFVLAAEYNLSVKA